MQRSTRVRIISILVALGVAAMAYKFMGSLLGTGMPPIEQPTDPIVACELGCSADLETDLDNCDGARDVCIGGCAYDADCEEGCENLYEDCHETTRDNNSDCLRDCEIQYGGLTEEEIADLLEEDQEEDLEEEPESESEEDGQEGGWLEGALDAIFDFFE